MNSVFFCAQFYHDVYGTYIMYELQHLKALKQNRNIRVKIKIFTLVMTLLASKVMAQNMKEGSDRIC